MSILKDVFLVTQETDSSVKLCKFTTFHRKFLYYLFASVFLSAKWGKNCSYLTGPMQRLMI